MSAADERILEQVQNLVAKIEHPNTSETEREMCRARADTLMFRYAIDEAMVRKAEKASIRTKPITRKVVISGAWNEHRENLERVLRLLADTNRCRVVGVRLEDQYIGHIVGFEADVRFVEMMYVSIHLTFAGKVDPKWNMALTEGQNVRILKEAGFKWRRIVEMGGWEWPDNGMVSRLYRRQCAADGVAPQMHVHRHDAYRTSFAEAFFSHLTGRMWTFSNSRDEQVKAYEAETGASGTALVLADRKTDVDEAFYELWPDQKPLSDEQSKAMQVRAAERVARADALAAAEREAFLASMSPAKRAAFLRREIREAESERIKQEKEWARWDKQDDNNRARRYDLTGRRAGKAAADAIDLSGGRNSVTAPTRKEIG